MKFTKLMILMASASLIFGCGGKEERITAYMQKAQESYEAGDYDKARIDIKNALQIDPNNARARFMLGRAFEGNQDYMKAYRAYNKAVELSPEEPEYLAKLGKFYLVLGGDVDKAREQLDAIKKVAPDSAHAMLLEAGIAAQEGDTDRALALSTQVNDAEPGNIENAIFMSSILSKDDRHGEAVDVLRTASELNPENVLLQLKIARTHLDAGDTEQSIAILKRIIEMEPSVYSHHINLALVYNNLGMVAQSEQVLRDAIDLKEDDVERRVNLISFIQNAKSVDDAIGTAREQIAKIQEDGMLRLKLAQLQLVKGDQPAATETLEEIVELYPEDQFGIKARLQLAAMGIERKDFEGASKWVDQAFTIASNDPEVNMLKAQLDLVNGNLDQAVVSLRNVIKDDPNNLQAYMLLARAHVLNGEQQQAQDIVIRAHENNRGHLENLLKLAQFHMTARNFGEAEKVIDDHLRLDDTAYDALSIKASVLNVTGRRDEAVEYADRLLKNHPTRENGYIQKVPALIASDAQEEALELLESGIGKVKERASLVELYSRIQLARGEKARVIDLLREETAGTGDVQLYLILARIYMEEGSVDEAIRVVDDALSAHPGEASVYSARANLHLMQGSTADALGVLDEGIGRATAPLVLYLNKATIQEKTGRIADAISTYRDILESNPNHLVATNNLAALLVHDPDKESIDEALELSLKLEAINQLAIQDTVGWVNYHAGNIEKASSILETVVSKEGDNQIYNYHLGMILHRKGEMERARQYLQRALDKPGDFEGRSEAEDLVKQSG